MGAIKTLTLKLHYAKKQRVNKPVPWYARTLASCIHAPHTTHTRHTTSHTGSLVSRRVR